MTLGCIVHFFNEPNALPGFIQQAPEMFDEVVFVSTPPDGKTDEESCQIVLDAGYPLLHNTVSEGYGTLRTWCISQTKCDWAMICDADERIWAAPPRLTVTGSEKWPASHNPNVQSTETGGAVDQKGRIRQMIEEAESQGALAICLSRRHWMTEPGKWAHPCQNWSQEADWQLRCVKNTPYLCYDPEVRMHERLISTQTWSDPKFIRGNTSDGPFMDHYSVHFKAMDPAKNKQDAQTYEALTPGCVQNMWLSHQPGVQS